MRSRENLLLLLNKKSKLNIDKPVKYLKKDVDETRHFTPAAQEWHNSIYTYNNNYLKTLPSADINLMKLLKIYFNDQIKIKEKKSLKGKRAKGKNNGLLVNNIKILNKFQKLKLIEKEKIKRKKLNKLWKKRSKRLRRLSTRRVYVGKGDLKHTNDKVIITFYLYNVERMYWSNLYKKENKKLFYPNQSLLWIIDPETAHEKRKKKQIWYYNRWATYLEYPHLHIHYKGYYAYLAKKLKKYNTNLKKFNKKLVKLKKHSLFLRETDQISFKKLYKKLMKRIERKRVNWIYPLFSEYLNRGRIRYLRQLYMYRKLLILTKVKYKYTSLKNIIPLIESIYNKKVIFNIINLKKMHLNSDIYTQIVSMKLKNRNNKLYKVLKASLRKVMVETIYKIEVKKGKPDRNSVLFNRIRNNTVSSMLNYNNCKITLNNLLFKHFYKDEKLEVKLKRSRKNRKSSQKVLFLLKKYIIKELKHGVMRGIRVEAKGRLTRRRTAARSVFKMKYIGGLKNVDSSFKGLSAPMLRGDRKSNVEYSIVNTNGRNGAFGVKGWVSSI